MKTNLYSLILLFSSCFILSQVPTGYYDGTMGLTGAALKTKLSQIITNGHIDKGYSGLWTAYKTTDIDKNYENDGSIMDIYSERPASVDPYKYTPVTNQCGTYSVEGNCYNREHIIPQSLFSQAAPMVSDIHFIRATDGKVNGMRSNYPFGKVGTATWTSLNGGKLGNCISSGYSGTVFEPIDEFKGDVARMIFYFVTRYESKLSTFSSGNMIGSSPYPGLQTWQKDLLLAWHNQDPVSAAEINRNNASYIFQGNRNPFIDRPEFVGYIWGGSAPSTGGDTTAPSVPSNLISNNVTSASATVSWNASTDNVGVTGYKVYKNGTLYNTVTTNSVSLSGLTAGTAYSITISAFDAAGNNSAFSSALNLTTLAGSGTVATDLYISEYLEGSSNNKAIEITNKTGNTVTLSAYTIKKQVNGSSTWTTVAILSGTLATNKTYTIAHTSYSLSCGTTFNLKTANLDFNGNDAVAIFKNNVLIDVVGYINNATVFAQDKTIRKNVSKPSTTYQPTEWNNFANDVCSDLGTPNPGIGSTNKMMTSPKSEISSTLSVKPNPVKDGEIFVESKENQNFGIYNWYGKLLQTGRTNEKTLLKNLPKGIYIIKSANQSTKFIVE